MKAYSIKAAILIAAVFLLGSCKTSELKLTSKRYKDALEQIEQLKAENERLKARKNEKATADLNKNVKNALPGFSPDELTVETRNGKVYVLMSDKLLFASGSATVQEKGKYALKKLSDVLQKYPAIEVTVEGHTDNVAIKGGTFRDNWDLSVTRATNITRILTEYKMNPARITAAGRSEFSPSATNSTAQGRARNRRTEIILTPAETTQYSQNVKK